MKVSTIPKGPPTPLGIFLGGIVELYKSYGSIEGRLDAILLQRKPAFKVYDSMEKGTLCYFDKTLLGEVQAALGKRVSVSGLIHCGEAGGILKVDVDSIDTFPSEEDLPTLEDVIGVLE